jgi:hypothetical protein
MGTMESRKKLKTGDTTGVGAFEYDNDTMDA